MEENIINQHRQSKNNFERLKKVLKNPIFYAGVLFKKLSPYIKDDELYLRILWRLTMRTSLNLKNPKTFNEKLQWLKLHDRRPEYTQMVDKYEAKKYVADIIGEEYIIPTLGVWDRFDDIDFDSLPNQFVLKCTHDSGGLVICNDKSKLDIKKARKKINQSLKRDFFFVGREWPYKNVKPRIIAEKYMEDTQTKELRDYKFFCFDGFAKAMFIASERQSEDEETKFDFFDMNFVHLPFTNGHPNSKHEIKRPETFEKMKELAGKLSEGIPHVRVDFYEIDGRIYFGELTFSHWSGLVPFVPEEWDEKFGEWIHLPESAGGGELIANKGFVLWLHIMIDTDLKDYKIHCFNGQPKFTLVCSERFSDRGLCEDFFDNDWKHLDLRRPTHPNTDKELLRPQNFEIMKQLATQLSRNIPFVRIDFYEINGEVFFGEITFFPMSGFEQFIPDGWDYAIGEMIKLPSA